MKKEAQYVHRLKQLMGKLKKAPGASEFWEGEDPMELLLWSILSAYASESRATAALTKLQAAMADYNELRVTSVAEIVEIIGADYPMCRPAAEEISRTLQAVFNRLHHLDLSFLKTGARRTAESFVNGLDGMGAHAKAMMELRCFKGHIVPVDANMFAFLEKSGCIPPETTVEQAQKFVAGVVKERDTANFYTAMKRHAAMHAPRKGVAARPAPPAAAKVEPAAIEEAAKSKAKAKAVESLKERAAAASRPKAAPERKAVKAKSAPSGKRAASGKAKKKSGG